MKFIATETPPLLFCSSCDGVIIGMAVCRSCDAPYRRCLLPGQKLYRRISAKQRQRILWCTSRWQHAGTVHR